jgi:hypothetical protein
VWDSDPWTIDSGRAQRHIKKEQALLAFGVDNFERFVLSIRTALNN